MLEAPMDVNTKFNVYRIDYIQTHSYEGSDKLFKPKGFFLVANSMESAEFYFEEEYNRHGDIFEITILTCALVDVDFNLMGYYYKGIEQQEREDGI